MPQTIALTLLEQPSFSRDQLSNSLGMVQSRLGAGPEFDFRMRVPQGWEASFFPEAAPAPAGPPALLMQASPAAGRDVEITVWCALLAREINPVDWLEAWIGLSGHVIADFRNFSSSYGVLGDALTHAEDRDTPGIRRILTVKDGNRLFLVEAAARRDEPPLVELMQNVFLACASTFELLAPSKARFAEPFEELALGGGAPLAMLVPARWQRLAQDETPPEGAALVLDNGGNGTIVIASQPGPDGSADLEEVLVAKLRATGLDVKAFDKTRIVVPNATMSVLARSTRAELQGSEMIVMTARCETPRLSAAVILVSPSEDQGHQVMAVNRRAFEVLLDSLHPA